MGYPSKHSLKSQVKCIFVPQNQAITAKLERNTMILRTLGQLKLEPSSFSMMKPLLMLVYVALEGPQVRRKLADLFWQDSSNPMKSVSMALTRLRQGAEESIQVNKNIVSTNLPLDVQALQVAFQCS